MVNSRSQEEQILRHLAGAITRRGLITPALLTLEAGRPLALIASQFLWVAQPALAMFLPREDVGRLARLLEEPGTVEKLINYLTGVRRDE
jgi:hypothetical protein